ncbi:MAG: Rrf2 family transcriptional regulator [Verrucomicrobiota bacterium]
MKISRKSIYAVRALIEIQLRSQNQGPSWQQISQIAQTTGIPEKFLEQILLALKKGGFLKSRRGVDGGYALNRSAEAIGLNEIFEALDGKVAPQEEIEDGLDGSGSVLRDLVTEAEQAAKDVFQKKNLADLANETKKVQDDRNPGIEFQI